MSNNNQEIESKFYVHNLAAIETRLKTLGAACRVPRGFEYNLRYDNAEGSLSAERKVLRLRQFDDVRLTFKGPGENIDGALARTEIELIINDFETAKEFLAGLGYEITMIYEKYRAMFELDGALITLDELPYGRFVEIEAESPEDIRTLARKLGLKPKTAIPASYQGLFEQLRKSKNLAIKHLTFEAFAGIQIYPDELGVRIADEN
jgi:adenylate cyclase class 2